MRIITLLLVGTVFCVGILVAGADDGAEKFWSEFRGAVINYKFDKVVSLTHFPFEIKGLDEYQPPEYHGRKGFRRNYERILVTPFVVEPGDKLLLGNMLKLVQKKTKLTRKDYLTADIIRIEQFEFERIKGRWFFTRAYVEE